MCFVPIIRVMNAAIKSNVSQNLSFYWPQRCLWSVRLRLNIGAPIQTGTYDDMTVNQVCVCQVPLRQDKDSLSVFSIYSNKRGETDCSSYQTQSSTRSRKLPEFITASRILLILQSGCSDGWWEMSQMFVCGHINEPWRGVTDAALLHASWYIYLWLLLGVRPRFFDSSCVKMLRKVSFHGSLSGSLELSAYSQVLGLTNIKDIVVLSVMLKYCEWLQCQICSK